MCHWIADTTETGAAYEEVQFIRAIGVKLGKLGKLG